MRKKRGITGLNIAQYILWPEVFKFKWSLMLQLQLCTLQAMVTIISERFKVRTDQAKIIYINEDSNALKELFLKDSASHN